MASIIKVDQIQESTTGVGTSFPHIIYADDDTTSNTPVLSFIGDTNTGIGRSAPDTLDLITAGNSRFRIEPTGQIKATYESQVGTDYNTTLHNGYLCRAWVNFTGTGTIAINGSGNVSTLNDLDTGTYKVNFLIAMPDINYAAIYSNQRNAVGRDFGRFGSYDSAVDSVKLVTTDNNGDIADFQRLFLAVFR